MIVDGMLRLPSTINQRPSTFLNFFDAALHVKVGFGHVVVFAVQDFLETADGVRHRHLFARTSREYFRHAEWLAQETLDLPGAKDGEPVVGRKLVHRSEERRVGKEGR